MVWPALLALGGAGAQSYGASQRTAAQERALDAYQEWLGRFNGTQDASDAQMGDLMGALGDEYTGSQQELANTFDPSSRISEFDRGMNQSRGDIQQVLSVMGSMQPHQNLPTGGDGSVFAGAAAREQASNAGSAARLTDVVAQGAGLEAMQNRDGANVFSFTDNAKELNNKIQRAQQLYGYGNALRNKALTRASGQHAADMQQASMAGNGAMMVGGLMGAGAQAWGSHQANSGDPSYTGPTPSGTQSSWGR